MRIRYKAKYDLTKPCVAKLWFGEKYVIIKTDDIRESLKEFKQIFRKGSSPAEGLEQFLLRRVRGVELEKMGQECLVEIVLASNRGEELLAREQVLLNTRDKANCLNKAIEPKRPAWLYELMSDRPRPQGFFGIKGRHRACPAVVKLWAGEKFMIWKCKDIQEFVYKFNESMEKNIERYRPGSGDLMNNLVRHILDNKVAHGTIEVLYKAEVRTPRWLRTMLKIEKGELEKNVGSPHCLNRTKKQNIPKWIKELL